MKPHKIDYAQARLQLELALKFLAEAKAANDNPKAQMFVDEYLIDAGNFANAAAKMLAIEHNKYHLAQTFALAD